jgi:hypothetical protein
MSPFGAMARPSGSLPAPPEVTVMIAPGTGAVAPGIVAIRLARLSAMYSVPRLRPRPVGPTMHPPGELRQLDGSAIPIQSGTASIPAVTGTSADR